jgi:hypothetical protein
MKIEPFPIQLYLSICVTKMQTFLCIALYTAALSLSDAVVVVCDGTESHNAVDNRGAGSLQPTLFVSRL